MKTVKLQKIIKIITSAFLIILFLLTTTLGVVAITKQNNSQINLSLKYDPEYLIKVEIQNQQPNEYITIYNSNAPQEANEMYINSISSNTIILNSNAITPNEEGNLHFRLTNFGEKIIKCEAQCGEYAISTSLQPNSTTNEFDLQTGATSETTSNLGELKISLNFQEVPYTIQQYSNNEDKPTKGTFTNSQGELQTNYYEYYAIYGEYPQQEIEEPSQQELSTNFTQLDYNLSVTSDLNQTYDVISTIYYNKTNKTRYNHSITPNLQSSDSGYINTWQKFEPIKWIILGANTQSNEISATNETTGEEYKSYSEENQILFTTENKTDKTNPVAGKYYYENGIFYIFDNTLTPQPATSLLLLSEYVLTPYIQTWNEERVCAGKNFFQTQFLPVFSKNSNDLKYSKTTYIENNYYIEMDGFRTQPYSANFFLMESTTILTTLNGPYNDNERNLNFNFDIPEQGGEAIDLEISFAYSTYFDNNSFLVAKSSLDKTTPTKYTLRINWYCGFHNIKENGSSSRQNYVLDTTKICNIRPACVLDVS